MGLCPLPQFFIYLMRSVDRKLHSFFLKTICLKFWWCWMIDSVKLVLTNHGRTIWRRQAIFPAYTQSVKLCDATNHSQLQQLTLAQCTAEMCKTWRQYFVHVREFSSDFFHKMICLMVFWEMCRVNLQAVCCHVWRWITIQRVTLWAEPPNANARARDGGG